MNCLRCEHPLADHCKGNEAHTDHKEDQRYLPMDQRKKTIICKTRHCKLALCSCVDFVEPVHETA